MKIQDPKPVRNWQDAINHLQEARAEYNRYFPLMTEVERSQGRDDLYRLQKVYQPTIEAGVVAEFNAAVTAFQSAQKRSTLELAREITSWRAADLSAQMQVYQQRAEVALASDDPAGELAKLRDEGAAGDRYTKRASLEVLKGSLGKFKSSNSDERMAVNRIAQEAGRELEELRTSEGMRSAWAEGQAAFDALMASHKQLNTIAHTLGETEGDLPPYKGEIGKAWQRISGKNGTMLIDGKQV